MEDLTAVLLTSIPLAERMLLYQLGHDPPGHLAAGKTLNRRNKPGLPPPSTPNIPKALADKPGAQRSPNSVRGRKRGGRSPIGGILSGTGVSWTCREPFIASAHECEDPTAVLLLLLLVTQAASNVCGAQCVQHQLPNPSGHAMAHCHSMQPSPMARH